MKISVSLREQRTNRKFTRQQIADLLDISLRTYQTYETGTREPSITSLVKIADFYNISLDSLIGRTFPKDSLVDTK